MKLLLENWRKHLKEGDVIQGPWKSAEEKQKHKEFLIKNGVIANDIEKFISERMKEVYGSPDPNNWPAGTAEVFYEIDEMLNVLFPSGDENETPT
jgi:hypothetical protein